MKLKSSFPYVAEQFEPQYSRLANSMQTSQNVSDKRLEEHQIKLQRKDSKV